jgi:hypothetical protein
VRVMAEDWMLVVASLGTGRAFGKRTGWNLCHLAPQVVGHRTVDQLGYGLGMLRPRRVARSRGAVIRIHRE